MTADVVVVGAGIFGASTAVALQAAGIPRVVLLDAWGAGNARATSSDQSRVSRTAYGEKRLYTRWSWESLAIWKQWQRETGVEMFLPTGVLWLAGQDAVFRAASLDAMRELEIPVESWPVGEAARRFPQFSGIEDREAIYEPEAGLLLARQSLIAVVEMFERRGGVVLTGVDRPLAGAYVYACGPWLRTLFPDLLKDRLRVTRQEVFYFKASSPDFDAGRFPTWIEEGSQAGREFSFYGMPRLNGSIKIASDIRGSEFDATNGDRAPSKEGESAARAFLARRFPAFFGVGPAGAEVVDARVCQYEQTPDSHLIIDTHPGISNTWIAGGGSGHGFKLAPAVGRCVAQCILNNNRDAIPVEVRLH